MKRIWIALLALALVLTAAPVWAQEVSDGIYRGFYYDGGIEQIAIQFEIREGGADYTGRLCVIGAQLKEDKLEKLFQLH